MTSLPGVLFFHQDRRVQLITNQGFWKEKRAAPVGHYHYIKCSLHLFCNRAAIQGKKSFIFYLQLIYFLSTATNILVYIYFMVNALHLYGTFFVILNAKNPLHSSLHSAIHTLMETHFETLKN